MCIFNANQLAYQVGDKLILKDISFSVQEGERVTLVGPSGSGKSSLLKLLSTLVTPSSGDISFEGRSVMTLNPVEYRRQVSYCFQQPTLFGNTVRDNMAFPFEIRQLPFDEKKVLSQLPRVNLTPNHLEQDIKDLSGGEKQRIALLRNLLFEPKVLLLDEVTAGLDSATKRLVNKVIADYHAKGHTIIEVTHDEEAIQSASRIITIEKGGLVDDKRIRQ
ncbi:ABC transporter ATP-binding protein [Streptococcus halotolerans]|uniref:ABC transporter ATP-binding protein n=1 Tax=Streptococcus halotolerans TaxID=1814128 RepID=UPI000788DFA6|nr:ATP-binding cassette domain-containing protein [Streptococcus halotolerans]